MPCKENNNKLRNVFIDGLPVMLKELRPQYVIVYGRMPEEIFSPYKAITKFINFKSDIQKYFDKKER